MYLEKAKSLSADFLRYTSAIDVSLVESIGMNPKKVHETSRMASFISEKAKEHGIRHIIDIGAGQGYLSHLLVTAANLNVIAVESKDTNSSKSLFRAKKINKKIHNQGKFETINKIVTDDNINTITDQPSILIGLHTCGNLSPISLKLFIKEEFIKGLINVGCCYQHLTEYVPESVDLDEYHRRIGVSSNTKSLDETLTPYINQSGFPLSNYILTHFPNFFLGRLSRSLTIGEVSQKGLQKAEYNFKKMEYRAAFQAFLSEFFPTHEKTFALGNKIKKFSDFSEYVEKALSKMSLKTELAPQDLNDYYNTKFKHLEKKASILWVLRSVLSGPIENLIILDKVLYLQEQGINPQAWMIFDKEISPRNVVICAFKDF